MKDLSYNDVNKDVLRPLFTAEFSYLAVLATTLLALPSAPA